MRRPILSIFTIILFSNIAFAQQTDTVLFIGRYNTINKGLVCSDRTLVYEEMQFQKYLIKSKAFYQDYKGRDASSNFVSSKSCVIIYEYQMHISGFKCTPSVHGYKSGQSIQKCKDELNAYVAKYPNEFNTKPTIIYEWCGNNTTPKPDIDPTIDDKNKTTCPTYGFKYTNPSSYNCVALTWWSLSTKTNIVDANGNFKQSTDPIAKYFTIYYRKQGDILWTIDKRENTGHNVHTIAGLDACTTYELYLTTTCDNNEVSAPTNTIRCTTACTRPGVLTIDNITNHSAQVSSRRLTALVTYPCLSSASTQIRIVEYKTNTTAWQEVICNADSPCFLNSLSPGSIYRVRARYKYGSNLYSNYTNEVSFTTK